MKNKWLIGCIVILLALTSFSFPLVAQEKINLDIAQMIALAISNNLNLKKASYQLINVELEAKQLAAENLFAQSGILSKQKEINNLQQLQTFQNQKDQLIIELIDNYFRLVLAEKDITRKEKKLELEKAVLAEVEAQVAAGYSIDLELLQQGNAYYDALFSYEQTKLDYQQLLMEVKNNLGIKQETDISIRSIEMPHFAEIDLAFSRAKSRENSLSLKSKAIEIDLARIKLEKARINQESQLEIVKLENNLKIAELEKSILEQDLDFQVLTKWQNYRQSKNDILLSEQSLRQMEQNELIITRQVQAGLRTEDELLSAAIGVLDAEYRFLSSIRQYYQSYLELQRMMGILDEREIR